MAENINKNQPDAITPVEVSEIFDDERDVLLDHEYDGIKELDNHMPRWWVLGFVFCIFFAEVYLLHYHLMSGPSSQEEYEYQLAKAEEDQEAREKAAALVAAAQGNAVDESRDYFALLTDAESLAAGKAVFTTGVCVACHSADGGGLVGPNLTDEYWLHGCDMPSVIASIKNGFPSKAMPAYGGGKRLNAQELQEVASYILSLRGSTPASPKAADMNRAQVCSK